MYTNKLNFEKFIPSIMVIFLFLSSCSTNHNEDVKIENVPISKNYKSIKGENTEKTNPNTDILKTLKIIKSADVKYKVNNVKHITTKIGEMTNAMQGYISDLRYQNNLYQKENRFTIKIPQDKFNEIMDSISKFAIFIDYESITSKDVTEEFIDLQTRLNTKIEVKKRYENILRRKAKTVEEILATEEKLRVIQEEIEVTQGKLNYMSNKVSFSTIQVNLYEEVQYKEESKSYTKTFLSKIKNGFSYGWSVIENLIILLTHIWPLFLLGIGVLIYIKRKK